MTIWNLPM
jgi:hypothetical protein